MNTVAPNSQILTPKSNSDDDARLLEACQEFEAVLVGQMFSAMRENPMKSNFLGGGTEESLYGQMLDEEVARSVSHNQGVGLADMLFEQFTGHPPGTSEAAP